MSLLKTFSLSATILLSLLCVIFGQTVYAAEFLPKECNSILLEASVRKTWSLENASKAEVDEYLRPISTWMQLLKGREIPYIFYPPNFLPSDYYSFNFRSHPHADILVLSSGGADHWFTRSRKSPILRDDQKITHTDIIERPGVISADNNKWQWAEGAYDLILLSRGLCRCHGPLCCGPPAQYAEMKRFLKNVAKTLDSRRLHSMAVLDGIESQTSMDSTKLWIRIVAELQEEMPELKFEFVLRRMPWSFEPSPMRGLVVSIAQEKESTRERLDLLQKK